MRKELDGTERVIFADEAAVIVNFDESNVVTLPGISIVRGPTVMVMVYLARNMFFYNPVSGLERTSTNPETTNTLVHIKKEIICRYC